MSKYYKLALKNVLNDAEFLELPNYHRGKVRDSFGIDNNRRLMISTDRQSAFDKNLCAVPFKGQVLNQTAQFWFNKLEDICPNHVIEYLDPNVVIVKNLSMLPVEIVVRRYLTGSTSTSIWPMYCDGARKVYGNILPNGLIKNERLPSVILTPTTKGADGEHDLPITRDEVIDRGLVTYDQWTQLEALSFALFDRGQKIASQNNLILVDTKYEFGVDPAGQIFLADEVHTPDSSRYWVATSYDAQFNLGKEPVSLDKEFLRLWIKKQCDPYKDPIPDIPEAVLIEFSKKYINLFETITGKDFRWPDLSVPIRTRIKNSLQTKFPEFFS